MKTEWIREFPTKVGAYWFIGERYKRNDFAKSGGEKPRIELQFCEVNKMSNGVMVIGNGQFMYESELGDEWYFTKVELPEMPKFKNCEFRKILKS